MIFRGVATALITPFIDGNIDEIGFEKLLDYQLASGVDAVVVLGTTGEPATMSQEEKELAITIAVSKLKGKIPVIVGAGSNSTAAAVKSCELAEKIGADGLLVVTPYYNKCTQSGLIHHYSNIATATSLPIICYNVPSRTGVNMLPSTFSKLADIPNIVGIKEASGNMEQIMEYIRLTTGRATVYSGDDSLTIPTMAMGGEGVISVASNVCAEYVTAMTRAFMSGDLQKASVMQRDMLPLVRALFSEVNPIPVKYAAYLKGFCDGSLRLPLTEISEENARKLEELIGKY
ncbi:MAG: 4-hydroxy-tetrahydrodipicolinate synthase [Clostridiales bacterium]|nr:4-hydroxy-tetrahydrodipicolinate synthase [Clostridiales bacterium]